MSLIVHVVNKKMSCAMEGCSSHTGRKENFQEPVTFHRSSVPTVIALDTEMIASGPKGSVSMLARVSVVNRNGEVTYDQYVKPVAPVTDYRTPWSGIREEDLICAKDFYSVRQEVYCILKGCILVGHDLNFDLDILNLNHPAKYIRDTALYSHFRKILRVAHKPSLKALAKELLGRYIQTGEHSSVEDARTAMDLYRLFEKQWEAELA